MHVARIHWQKSVLLLIAIGIGILTLSLVWLLPRSSDSSAEAQVWTCSMHTQIRQDRPGKCPICGMDLVPVSQLSQEQAALKERAGVVTEPVAFRELHKEIRTVGKLDYNERRVAYLTARITGRIERVYADYAGMSVKKDDHLADIYSPDLITSAESLLQALRSGDRNSAESTRERLLRWGMLPKQIQEIEKARKVPMHLTIHAPIGGTVIEKNVREGQYVKEGDMLYRIADLDPIWLYLDIYEYDLGWVRFGQPVDVTVEAYPGEVFHGTVVFIDPFLDDKTRTVKVRVNLPNPERKLKPAMYASASLRVRLRSDGRPEPTGLEGKYICPMHWEVIRDEPGKCAICGMPLERVPGSPPAMNDGPAPGKVLAIPASAVLDTGIRKVAYRQTPKGEYELVELQVGPRADGNDAVGRKQSYYLVRAGLEAGDAVVVRGGFLLDSQTQIEGRPSLLYPKGQSGARIHSEHGPAPESETHKH